MQVCGGTGHLTRQCMNGVAGYTGDLEDLDMEAAAGGIQVRGSKFDPSQVASIVGNVRVLLS